MTNLKAFTMPKWGIEMSEGTVAEWMVAEGEPFAKSAVLTLIETDKITNEVEAEQPGCFVRLVAQPGETLTVGALLAVLGEPGTDAAEVDAFVANFKSADTGFAASASAAPVAEKASPAPAIQAPALDTSKISPAAHAAAAALGADIAAISGSGRGGRISLQDVEQAVRPAGVVALKGTIALSPVSAAFASPMARRLAAQHGVDLNRLAGTGPRGRISKADVLAAAGVSDAPEPASGSVVVQPMSKLRKVIARRLSESKATIPHFYVRRRIRMDRLIALRAAADPKPSINDYLIRACGLALGEVPALNIQVHGDAIHRFAQADIAVAVATDGGLITPVVTGVGSRSVAEISAVMADLGARARAGKLKQSEIEGGSFGLSNLGMFGVEQFDAIINPPQGAILAVGAARAEPIDDAGAVRVVPVLHVSLSCDHRAIDGADGGRFLVALAELLENPERL